MGTSMGTSMYGNFNRNSMVDFKERELKGDSKEDSKRDINGDSKVDSKVDSKYKVSCGHIEGH